MHENCLDSSSINNRSAVCKESISFIFINDSILSNSEFNPWIFHEERYKDKQSIITLLPKCMLNDMININISEQHIIVIEILFSNDYDSHVLYDKLTSTYNN